MANATHLTIGTVDRLCLGEPESELRQEVQVSITYVLSREDTDLEALAAEKAVEVRQAQQAAWQTLSGFSPEACGNADVSPVATGAGSSKATANGAPLNNGQRHDQNNGQRNGRPEQVPHNPAYAAGASRSQSAPAPPAATTPQPVTSREWITKPQKLAIQSLVKRREMTAPDLERMLQEQFNKRLLVMLTKSEAAALLRALERGSWESGEAEERGDEESMPACAA